MSDPLVSFYDTPKHLDEIVRNDFIKCEMNYDQGQIKLEDSNNF